MNWSLPLEYLLGYVYVGEPDTSEATECPDCGFDAVLTFPLTLMTKQGVRPWGVHRACLRCWAEQQEDP